MAELVRGFGIRRGKAEAAKSTTDNHLSKVVELNGKYRLFFPKFVDEQGNYDIMADIVQGRPMDYDITGSSYIMYDERMCRELPGGGFEDTTEMPKWARIGRVLFDAQCIREKKAKENEAATAAKALGKDIDTVSLSRALEGIELDYHGGKDPAGNKVMPKKQPPIGSLKSKTTTRLLIIKLNADDTPDWGSAQYAVLELSNARLDELIQLCNDNAYNGGDKPYLEVGYNYSGTNKQTAGQNAKLQGISSELALCKLYAEKWEEIGKAKVEQIVPGTTVEEKIGLIRAKNRNTKYSPSVGDVISKIKKWCATEAAIFASIDFESETTIRAAKDFLDANLLDTIPVIKEKFVELLKEHDDKEAEAPNLTSEEQDAVAQFQTVREAEAVSLGAIMQAAPEVKLDSDDFEDIGDLD